MKSQWSANSEFGELYREPTKTPLFEALSLPERHLILERLRFGKYPTKPLSELGFATSPKAAAGGCVLIRPSASNGRSTSAGRWLPDTEVPAALAYAMEEAAAEERLRAEHEAKMEPILRAKKEAREAAIKKQEEKKREMLRKRRARMGPKVRVLMDSKPHWEGTSVKTWGSTPGKSVGLSAIDNVEVRWLTLGLGPWSKAPAEIKALSKGFAVAVRVPTARLDLRDLSEMTTAEGIAKRVADCEGMHAQLVSLVESCKMTAPVVIASVQSRLEATESEYPGIAEDFPKFNVFREQCVSLSTAARRRLRLLNLLSLADTTDAQLEHGEGRCDTDLLALVPGLKEAKPRLYARARWGGVLTAVALALDPQSKSGAYEEAAEFIAAAMKTASMREDVGEALSIVLESKGWASVAKGPGFNIKPVRTLPRRKALFYAQAMKEFPKVFAPYVGSGGWFPHWRLSLDSEFSPNIVEALARAHLEWNVGLSGEVGSEVKAILDSGSVAQEGVVLKKGELPEEGVAKWCLQVAISMFTSSPNVEKSLSIKQSKAPWIVERAFILADMIVEMGAFGEPRAPDLLLRSVMDRFKGRMADMHPEVLATIEKRMLLSSVTGASGDFERKAKRL